LLPHKSVHINNNCPLHPPISLLVKQTQLNKLRAAHQSTMSLVLVNNQGQCCLHETRLMATSKLGLPHQLPHGLKDLTLEGKPLHLKVQEVKRQQNRLIAQEATKARCYRWPIPQSSCIPHPIRRHYPWRDS
jgi:hypothetical protein